MIYSGCFYSVQNAQGGCHCGKGKHGPGGDSCGRKARLGWLPQAKVGWSIRTQMQSQGHTAAAAPESQTQALSQPQWRQAHLPSQLLQTRYSYKGNWYFPQGVGGTHTVNFCHAQGCMHATRITVS